MSLHPKATVLIIGNRTELTAGIAAQLTTAGCDIITDEWASMVTTTHEDAMDGLVIPSELKVAPILNDKMLKAYVEPVKEPKNDNEFTKGGRGKKGQRRQFMRNHK